MGKSKTSGKGRLDKFYYLAKEQGYRSRAAFKLVQLNRKYQFLERSHSLLDLCAAPGGWLQVAAKYMPVSSTIIGIDLVPIKPIRGVQTLTQDITTTKCRSEIKKLMKGELMDVVLHDGSPNVGGAWLKESISQVSLALDALKLATEFLKPGGMFVSKVFRSQDYNSLLFAFKQLFEKVEATKPMASRSTSAEIYVVGLKYLAPKKIDPKLLDSKFVFKEIIEPSKPIDVIGKTKQKRFREGYEEGLSMVYKKSTAVDFIASDKPIEFLGSFHTIDFNGADCEQIRNHTLTSKEIITLCEDLQVLGKNEFKNLLKWRMAIKKDLETVPEEDKNAENNKTEKDETDKDKIILEEMNELREILDKKKKKQKKKLTKRKDKMKIRTATGMEKDVMEDDNYFDTDLFSLKSIKNKQKKIDDVNLEEAANEMNGEDDDDDEDDDDTILDNEEDDDVDEFDDDLDADSEKIKYAAEMEEYFDYAYEHYVNQIFTKRSKKSTRARLLDTTGQRGEDGEEGEEEEGEEERGEIKRRIKGMEEKDYGDELYEDEEDANALLTSLEEKEDKEKKKKKLIVEWFNQDLFNDLEMDEKNSKKKKERKTMEEEEDEEEWEEGEEESDVDDANDAVLMDEGKDAKKREREKKEEGGEGEAMDESKKKRMKLGIHGGSEQKKTKLNRIKLTNENAENDDFEIVKMEKNKTVDDVSSDADVDSDSDADSEDYDSDDKAEILAYAKKMLRKKQREDILDDSYNRYTFDDVDVQPKWFREDQVKFNQVEMPITKEEVEAMKAQFKAIDSRPVKKVAEAKARKRRVLKKKLDSVKQKASSITDQPDLNERAKSKMVERLYNKAFASANRERKKEVVVAKKGLAGSRGRGAGKGTIMVDKRMKKDTRGMDKGKKGKGKGAGKGKAKGKVKGGGKKSKKGR